MKHLNLQDLLPLVFLFSLAFGCQQGDQSEEPKKTSSAELKDQIKTQVDSLYSVYEKFGYDWIDFYDNEFTAIYPNSPVKVNSRDSLKAQWDGIYEKFTVKLVERGEPTIIESEDMAISYNSFNEIFIDKETNDTVKNVGTYIVAWKRQADDSWKIVFETLHNN